MATSPNTESLATYKFRSNGSSNNAIISPVQPHVSWSHMWFEAMVQMLVKRLGGSPCLLQVSTRGLLKLTFVPLTESDVSKGWEHIQQQHLGTDDAVDAVILVHPVPSQQQPCAVKVANKGQSCPGCPHELAAVQSHQQPELMHGKVGDCCSDKQPGHSSREQHHSHSHSPSSHSSSDSVLSYHGLVVQTSNAADPLQGCYLLKTVQVKQHSGGFGGCHCTHYSLTRVCQGPSLQQQYQAAWLVSN